jgi:hypothetical protein
MRMKNICHLMEILELKIIITKINLLCEFSGRRKMVKSGSINLEVGEYKLSDSNKGWKRIFLNEQSVGHL